MRERLVPIATVAAAFVLACTSGQPSAQALRERSKAHSDQKEFEAAITDVRRALELEPQDAWAHYHLGWLLSETAGCRAALPSYSTAIALDPQFWKAYLNRGYCELQLELFEDARADLTTVLEHVQTGEWRLLALEYRAQALRLLRRDEECRRDEDELERLRNVGAAPR